MSGLNRNDKELLQQALDALNEFDSGKRNHGMTWQVPLIKTIKARLAQPEPKPVAKSVDGWITWITNPQDGFPQDCFLYTAPPEKEWVGLTFDEIKDILDCGRGGLIDIKKAEQKLKEKNAA